MDVRKNHLTPLALELQACRIAKSAESIALTCDYLPGSRAYMYGIYGS